MTENFTQPGANTGQVSSDSKGKRWGFQFSPESIVSKFTDDQVKAINARTDINGEQKAVLISHLTGNHRNALIQFLKDHFSTGPGNQISGPATLSH